MQYQKWQHPLVAILLVAVLNWQHQKRQQPFVAISLVAVWKWQQVKWQQGRFAVLRFQKKPITSFENNTIGKGKLEMPATDGGYI